MEEVIAGLERFTFTLEKDVEMQKGIEPLPFQGMDKSSSAVCNFYAKGLCEKGRLCPFRHDHGEKTVVCKHWLRGLCKKGDQCRFLHQYDLSRMPECYFFSKFGECSNKECYFLHMKTASEAQACPSYDQGFCKEGPLCKYRHVKRVMCTNYLVGFCPLGPECQYAHPKMVPLFNPTPRAVRMVNKGISKPGFCLKAWPGPHPQ
ncbi:PREDICTED: putative cleavage and polyadenylation specificity factor subunit 4-like protein isoform X1 [Myotis brandtii]|uniref:putative cleavage and polyadenylation specificity factor subunit 4-like protein isoform X1 n=1 Tax=Myotis brandtii TaxID=109478 RepID=UPI000704122B|nr:PREDICTED: putative cleavage and polyadenylation specificity factor subunit 4-like protein isoform X1 [Myotis brandtii]